MSTEREQRSAVSLQWDGTGAPRVTAKGRGEIAERIIALARQHGVPLRENPELVTLLSGLKLDQEIPTSLYLVVAEVIAFAYALSGKQPPNHKDAPPQRPR
jgi:flagellar biosynthesis protein